MPSTFYTPGQHFRPWLHISRSPSRETIPLKTLSHGLSGDIDAIYMTGQHFRTWFHISRSLSHEIIPFKTPLTWPEWRYRRRLHGRPAFSSLAPCLAPRLVRLFL